MSPRDCDVAAFLFGHAMQGVPVAISLMDVPSVHAGVAGGVR